MSVLDHESRVEVTLTEKDLTDIAALRTHEYRAAGEDSDHFLRHLILAGIDKLREEQAAESYADMAQDPDYLEYHKQRRAGRSNRR